MSEVVEEKPKTTTARKTTARAKKPAAKPVQETKSAEDAPVQPTDVLVSEAVQESEVDTEQPKAKTGVLTHLMNVRQAPSKDAEVVAVYPKDQQVQVIGTCETDWVEIACPEAPSGVAYIWTKNGEFVKIE